MNFNLRSEPESLRTFAALAVGPLKYTSFPRSFFSPIARERQGSVKKAWPSSGFLSYRAASRMSGQSEVLQMNELTSSVPVVILLKLRLVQLVHWLF